MLYPWWKGTAVSPHLASCSNELVGYLIFASESIVPPLVIWFVLRDSMSDPHWHLTSNKKSHCWFVTSDTPPADLHLTKTHCQAPNVGKTHSKALGVKQFVLVQQLLNDLYISVFTKSISGVWCLQTWAYQRVFNWPTLGICVDFKNFTHQIEVCTHGLLYYIYITLLVFIFKHLVHSIQWYSISQEICTRFLLCCALLWLYIDWFPHIHQAYFTGTVAI